MRERERESERERKRKKEKRKMILNNEKINLKKVRNK